MSFGTRLMRIISGANRGKKLVQIRGRDIRPTSDRAREAIFNILGPAILNTTVLDVFAGTGALGLEALSRGAKKSVFIDNSKQSCKVIRENISLCRQEDNAVLYCHDIVKNSSPYFLENCQFDIIFLDPPYLKGYIEILLKQADFLKLGSDRAVFVAEHSIKENPFEGIESLDIFKQRKYSESMISFLIKPDKEE